MDDSLLLDSNSGIRWFILTVILQKKGIHEINEWRRTYGEYHHLFPQLRRDAKRFQRYVRMTPGTFDYIRDLVSPHLEKNWSNFIKTPILPEEKLVITLR